MTTKRMSELVGRFEEPAFNPEEVRNHIYSALRSVARVWDPFVRPLIERKLDGSRITTP